MPARILVINGNPADATARMVALGGRPYGEGYADALRHFQPGLDITVLDAADGDTLPSGVSLNDFHGVAWTGSALSAYEDRPEVTRQLELARAVHASGVPAFGSCWGQQIVCQALGGEVRANPKGTEIGVARDIARTSQGEGHPMFTGKPDPFDALAIHRDEVVTLPEGARVLASNTMSVIQAVDFEEGRGDFWGVQYHPEFDLHVMATLFRRDEETLLKQHLYADEMAVARAIEDFESLDADPSNAALAAANGLGQAILDPTCRMAELGNWLRLRVLPRADA